VTVLFDTLKLADRLEAAGLSAKQAHDMASAFADTLSADIVTRQDLQLAVAELKSDVRGWLLTQAFAIIGANAAITAIIAALFRWLH
jgi:hypothetical protein